jgi:hypothetical protein
MPQPNRISQLQKRLVTRTFGRTNSRLTRKVKELASIGKIYKLLTQMVCGITLNMIAARKVPQTTTRAH